MATSDTDHMNRMKEWIDGFPDDVKIVQKVVESAQANAEARQLAAAALSYLVTRMDLIPDWEETCGVIDDAMVLRVAMALALDKGADEHLDTDASRGVARLANDSDVVAEFLGGDLFPRFKKYVQALTGQTVRGRTPQTIVNDPHARKYLYDDIHEEVKHFPPAPMTDPVAVARTIRNYLTQKLGK
jgi:uncharacterized membrane protein YkvA (DUF1232 family)